MNSFTITIYQNAMTVTTVSFMKLPSELLESVNKYVTECYEYFHLNISLYKPICFV